MVASQTTPFQVDRTFIQTKWPRSVGTNGDKSSKLFSVTRTDGVEASISHCGSGGGDAAKVTFFSAGASISCAVRGRYIAQLRPLE